jgi:hypothetical protein
MPNVPILQLNEGGANKDSDSEEEDTQQVPQVKPVQAASHCDVRSNSLLAINALIFILE